MAIEMRNPRHDIVIDEKVRQMLLQSVGLDPESSIPLLKRALSRAEQLLDADRIETISYKGEVTAELPRADNPVRQRAAEFLVDTILDLHADRKKNEAQFDGTINVAVTWFAELPEPQSPSETPPNTMLAETRDN